ncbi:MAG: LysR family transcriptional regulator [Holosporales bacterium]
MKISLEALRILDAIDRNKSFSLAAEEIHRAPSALTYSIQQLESRLKIQIFDRSGHRAQLTDMGRHLLEEGRRLLSQAQQLEKQIERGLQSSLCALNVAYDQLLGDTFIAEVAKFFLAANTQHQLSLQAEVLNGTWDSLLTERAEVALGASGAPPVDLHCKTETLATIPFVFAVHPSHPLAAANRPLAPDDISSHRTIILRDSTTRLAPLSSGFHSGPGSVFVNSMQEKIALQLAGVGVGYLPQHLAAPYVQRGDLQIKAVQYPKSPAKLNLAWKLQVEGPALTHLLEAAHKAAHQLFCVT